MGGIVSKQMSVVDSTLVDDDVGLLLGRAPSDELKRESTFAMRLINNFPDVLKLLKANTDEVEQFGKTIKKTSKYYKTMNEANLTCAEAFTANSALHKNPPDDVNVVHKVCLGLTNSSTADPFTPCAALDDLYQKVSILVQELKDLTEAGKSEYKILDTQRANSNRELEKLKKRCADRAKKLQEYKTAPLASIAEKTRIDFEIKNLEQYIVEDKITIQTHEETIQKIDRSIYNILTHFEVLERKRVLQLQTLAHGYFQIRKVMALYLASQMKEVLNKVSVCQHESEMTHLLVNCGIKPSV